MAINVDLSKPLTEDEIAYLEARYPLNMVEHYIALAQGAEFEGGRTEKADTPEKKPAAKGSSKVPPPPESE